jgi:HPt (histidine-containing phosphotransfer) domain-containing protein
MELVALLEEFVNLPDLLGRVENDRELLIELLTLFQEELPGSREALQSAIRTGDLRETANAAHRFKGMLANLSVKSDASLAAEIEAAARAGDSQKIRELIPAFESRVDAFSAALQAFLTGTSQ